MNPGPNRSVEKCFGISGVNDYILLMHSDSTSTAAADDVAAWEIYFKHLRKSGLFDGGSSIGKGMSFRKAGDPAKRGDDLSGYIRVRAVSLEQAKSFLVGNPVYEAGGTVEIHELPRD